MSYHPDYPPSGCHHCGIGERHHARQWTDAAGWHGFTEPSRELIAERMRAKYADRIEAHRGAARCGEVRHDRSPLPRRPAVPHRQPRQAPRLVA